MLEENFIEYKVLTLKIIKTVNVGEYERLEEIFQKRQLILDGMNKSNYLKEEMNKLYIKYEIQNLEKILAVDIKVKEKDLLKKIDKNKNRQIVVTGYNNISAKAVFLSKEV